MLFRHFRGKGLNVRHAGQISGVGFYLTADFGHRLFKTRSAAPVQQNGVPLFREGLRG